MPPNKILIDSSFLIALYDLSADEHSVVKAIADLYEGQFLVPQVVLTEVVYLLKREMGVPGAANFLEMFADSNPILQDVTVEDLRRTQAIMRKYASAKLDFVDCCIIALAERLNVTQVGTLDQRDFRMVRPTHCEYFELLP
jgi:uncharacterized protein